MNAIKWEPSYTGISTAELGPLYLQRDTKTKRLQFARISGVWLRWRGRVKFAPMLGVFCGGRTNHLNTQGWELFTGDLHCGWVNKPHGNLAGCSMPRNGVHWSGSAVEPYYTYTLVLGRLFIGSTTDKWLVKLVTWHKNRQYEREQAAFNAAHPYYPCDTAEEYEAYMQYVQSCEDEDYPRY